MTITQGETKYCSKCQTTKSVDEFWRRYGGYQCYCKDCSRKYNARSWVCRRCKVVKPSHLYSYGTENICSECKLLLPKDMVYCSRCGEIRSPQDVTLKQICRLCKRLEPFRIKYEDLLQLWPKDSRCPICLCDLEWDTITWRSNWVIDHDHSCCPEARSCGNCIRGIVCYVCNTRAVPVVEDVELFTRAMAYVHGKGRAKKIVEVFSERSD